VEPPKSREFEKFRALTKKVVAVPRSEILKREAEYKESRKNPPKNDNAKAV
jgi:hypothetical protein